MPSILTAITTPAEMFGKYPKKDCASSTFTLAILIRPKSRIGLRHIV